MANALNLLQRAANLSGYSNSEVFTLEPNSPTIQTALAILNGTLEGFRSYPYTYEKTLNENDSLIGLDFTSISSITYQTYNTKLSSLRYVTPEEFDRESVIVGMESTPTIYTFYQATRTLKIYPKPSLSVSYVLNIIGMPFFKVDSLVTELSAFFPQSFQLYLIYEVGFNLINEINLPASNWNENKDKKRQELLSQIKANRTVDTKADPSSDFDSPSSGALFGLPMPSFDNNEEVLAKLAKNDNPTDMGANLIGYFNSQTATATNVGATLNQLLVSGPDNQIKHVITSSGMVIDVADNTQLAKSIANYVHLDNFYTDSGVANAYVPEKSDNFELPSSLENGLRIRLDAENTNTGASTLEFLGQTLPIKNIFTGDDLTASEIKGSSDTFHPVVELEYSSSDNVWYLINNNDNTGDDVTKAELASQTSPTGASLVGYASNETVESVIAEIETNTPKKAQLSNQTEADQGAKLIGVFDTKTASGTNLYNKLSYLTADIASITSIISSQSIQNAVAKYSFSLPVDYDFNDMFVANAFDTTVVGSGISVSCNADTANGNWDVYISPVPTGNTGQVTGMFTKRIT